MTTRNRMGVAMLVLLTGVAARSVFGAEKSPAVGQAAPNFSLRTIDDQSVSLDDARKNGPVVLVVLRGWPGYQCPLCTAQFADLRKHAADFASRNATVLLVYPGPADGLTAHAKEFVTDDTLPAGFKFLLDPDYVFTNAWHLRWDEAGETAYPSSFVIARDGKIRLAKVSKSHGGRTSANELLTAIDQKS